MIKSVRNCHPARRGGMSPEGLGSAHRSLNSTLAPQADSAKLQHYASRENPQKSSCGLFAGIHQCPMPIRRESLQILKAKRTDQHRAANDKEVSGVSESEDRTEKSEDNYMLEVSKSPHAWVHERMARA
jgi:hypothetical protein